MMVQYFMSDKELSFQQFIRNLSENKTAQEYYLSRGLSKKLVRQNLIGFCPIYSHYTFPLLRGRIILPIRDVYGNTIALAGRQIPDLKESLIKALWESYGHEPAKCQDRITKWSKGKWINEPYSKAKNLYFLDVSKNEIAKKNYIVLVEGYFDVLSFYDNGVCNIAALCGTAITDHQIALASRFCDNIVVIMDADGPGKIAAKKIVDKVTEWGLNAFTVFLPFGMDPDDFARKYDMSFFDNAITNMIENDKKELYINV